MEDITIIITTIKEIIHGTLQGPHLDLNQEMTIEIEIKESVLIPDRGAIQMVAKNLDFIMIKVFFKDRRRVEKSHNYSRSNSNN